MDAALSTTDSIPAATHNAAAPEVGHDDCSAMPTSATTPPSTSPCHDAQPSDMIGTVASTTRYDFRLIHADSKSNSTSNNASTSTTSSVKSSSLRSADTKQSVTDAGKATSATTASSKSPTPQTAGTFVAVSNVRSDQSPLTASRNRKTSVLAPGEEQHGSITAIPQSAAQMLAQNVKEPSFTFGAPSSASMLMTSGFNQVSPQISQGSNRYSLSSFIKGGQRVDSLKSAHIPLPLIVALQQSFEAFQKDCDAVLQPVRDDGSLVVEIGSSATSAVRDTFPDEGQSAEDDDEFPGELPAGLGSAFPSSSQLIADSAELKAVNVVDVIDDPLRVGGSTLSSPEKSYPPPQHRNTAPPEEVEHHVRIVDAKHVSPDNEGPTVSISVMQPTNSGRDDAITKGDDSKSSPSSERTVTSSRAEINNVYEAAGDSSVCPGPVRVESSLLSSKMLIEELTAKLARTEATLGKLQRCVKALSVSVTPLLNQLISSVSQVAAVSSESPSRPPQVLQLSQYAAMNSDPTGGTHQRQLVPAPLSTPSPASSQNGTAAVAGDASHMADPSHSTATISVPSNLTAAGSGDSELNGPGSRSPGAVGPDGSPALMRIYCGLPGERSGSLSLSGSTVGSTSTTNRKTSLHVQQQQKAPEAPYSPLVPPAAITSSTETSSSNVSAASSSRARRPTIGTNSNGCPMIPIPNQQGALSEDDDEGEEGIATAKPHKPSVAQPNAYQQLFGSFTQHPNHVVASRAVLINGSFGSTAELQRYQQHQFVKPDDNDGSQPLPIRPGTADSSAGSSSGSPLLKIRSHPLVQFSQLMSLGSAMSMEPAHPFAYTSTLQKTTDDLGMKILNNKYVVMDTLGQGACGKVKLAFSVERNISVAIKIVRKESHQHSAAVFGRINDARVAALQHEIAVMKKLRHKNIVSLYEVIDDPEAAKLYLVMQYVDNGCITHVLPNCTCEQFPLDRVAFIARQVAAGLEYLHMHGIVHRDLKPENILLSSNDQVFLSDFGIADSLALEDTTIHGRQAGTPLFMAPELLRGDCDIEELHTDGKPPTTGATLTVNGHVKASNGKLKTPLTSAGKNAMALDIWAFGVTLYGMIAGRLPFTSLDDIRERPAHVEYDPSLFTPEWKELLSSMMNPTPQLRPSVRVLRKRIKSLEHSMEMSSMMEDLGATMGGSTEHSESNQKRREVEDMLKRIEITPHEMSLALTPAISVHYSSFHELPTAPRPPSFAGAPYRR